MAVIIPFSRWMVKMENADESNIPDSMTVIERLDETTLIVEIKGKKFLLVRQARMLAIAPWSDDGHQAER